MIEKIFNYKNTKYTKLTTYDIVAIILGVISLFFILSSIDLSLEGETDLLGVIMGFSVLPLSFLFIGWQTRKIHSLDTWVKTNDNSIYFIEPKDKDSLKMKHKFEDEKFLTRIIQTKDNSYCIYNYIIEKIVSIEEKRKYIILIFEGKNNYKGIKTKKKVYVMKNMQNFNEFLNEINEINL